MYILENENHKSIQSRIPTPHTLKVPKAKLNPVDICQNNATDLRNAKDAENKDKLATKTKQKKIVMKSEESVRRSSRLASIPSKNYKI